MRAFVDRIDFRIAGVPVLHTPVLGQLYMAMKREFTARTWFRAALPKGFDIDSIWNVARAVYALGGQFCLASIVQGQELIAAEDVNVSGCSANVAWGLADRTHRKTQKDSIRAHLPGAAIHYLNDCGHCPDIEAPQTYSRLLLTGLPPTSAACVCAC